MQARKPVSKRLLAVALAILIVLPLMPSPFEFSLFPTEPAQAANVTIGNNQFTAVIGDLGQIRELRMKNNRTSYGTSTFDADLNFVIGNTSSREASTAHQWTGELIFATRSAASREALLASTAAFQEQDTNKTLANGGSTTTNTIAANNPRYSRTDTSTGTTARGKVVNRFIGLGNVPYTGTPNLTSADARIMRGYDVTSTFDMATDDGSLLWTIQVENKSEQWIEFGDIGMPMSWNTQYNGNSQNTNYISRVVASAYAGVDSGYAHVKRASGEGSSLIFAPVPETGARIEYVDQWFRNFQGIAGERHNSMFYDWAHDSSNWSTGMAVYYLHSKNIRNTGAGYHMDNTSLILGPGEKSPEYKFKFMPVRTGDNSPGAATDSFNLNHPINDNLRRGIETEANLRSTLYKSGMVDAVAVPSYQAAINMPAKLNLHFDKEIIRNAIPRILCVHQDQCALDCSKVPGHNHLATANTGASSATTRVTNNSTCVAALSGHVHGRDCDYNDPYDGTHIPVLTNGTSTSATNYRPTQYRQRGYRGIHNYYDGTAGKPLYTKSATLNKEKSEDGFFKDARGEWNQVWDLEFACIGNNSVRVDYELNIGTAAEPVWVKKFTQFEFNVLAELDDSARARGAWTLRNQQTAAQSSTYAGLFLDGDLHIGARTSRTNWADDWGHPHFPMMTQKNLLQPVAAEIRAIERYVDMLMSTGIVTESSGAVRNSLTGGARSFSRYICGTGFFGMYKIMKAYPELITYSRDRNWYLEMARRITNGIGSGGGTAGVYGEQEAVDIYEAMVAERALGATNFTATNVNDYFLKYVRDRGRNLATTRYPYVSEFPFDNTGDEAAFAYPQAYLKYIANGGLTGETAANINLARNKLTLADLTTRAKRSFANTWFNYGTVTFLGGEAWWNFQYTTGLAGSNMDDYLRYQSGIHNYSNDQRAWANRLNYAAKISHFNCINMGQIAGPRPGTATSDVDNFGAMAFRYTMAKGGRGDQNSNGYNGIGGNGMANNASFNGWYAFSGEADEGIYGSLLRISTDVVTDPIFGTFAYGGVVKESATAYDLDVRDGFGARVHFLNEMIFVRMNRDKIENIIAAKDGKYFNIDLRNTTFGQTTNNHTAIATLQGLAAGNMYFVYVDGLPVDSSFFTSVAGDNKVSIPVPATSEMLNVVISTTPPEGVIVSVDASATVNKFINEPISIKGGVFTQGEIESIKWSVPNAPEGAVFALANGETLNPTFTTNTKGSYTIRLTAANELEEEGFAEATFTVADPADYPAPTASASIVSGRKFVQAAYVLTGAGTQSIPGGTITFAWSAAPSAGVTFSNAAIASPTVSFAEPGEYTLTLSVTDRIGRTATANITVTALGFDALEPPIITEMVLGTLVDGKLYVSKDRNNAARATATTEFPGGGLSYAWTIAPAIAGNTVAGANTTTPTFNFTNYGTYAVTFTVTDIGGKSVSMTRYVTVADAAPREGGHSTEVNTGASLTRFAGQVNMVTNSAPHNAILTMPHANGGPPTAMINGTNATGSTTSTQQDGHSDPDGYRSDHMLEP